MRKLGKGQSVVFCIPEEVQSKIRTATKKPGDVGILVPDVLIWAISETYADLRRSMLLWAMQGVRFERQKALWAEITSSTGIFMSPQQARKFLADEAQSIEHRYRPDLTQPNIFPSYSLAAIQERCEEFDSLHFKSSALQEQQERELSPEVEQEQQVQRPDRLEPETHRLHQDVISFVKTGMLRLQSPAFIPAFPDPHKQPARPIMLT
jgi:hypothetical protein